MLNMDCWQSETNYAYYLGIWLLFTVDPCPNFIPWLGIQM